VEVDSQWLSEKRPNGRFLFWIQIYFRLRQKLLPISVNFATSRAMILALAQNVRNLIAKNITLVTNQLAL